MATNTPNDDDEPPSNHPPFLITPPPQPIRTRIPAVTQTQTPENEFAIDDFTNPNCDEDTYIHFHDADLVHQTPQRPQRLTPIPAAPTVDSPIKASIDPKDALAKTAAKHKKRRATGRESMNKMQKRKKMNVKLSADKNVLAFLRADSVASMVDDPSTTVTMSTLDTITRSANSHWKGNKRNKIEFKPFLDLETSLMTSNLQPVTFQHHCLLIEEMMLLVEGLQFVCSVSSEHYFLQHAIPLNKIRKCLEIEPCQPCIIDRKVYFSFNLTVVSNPKYDVFDLGTMQSQADVIRECTKEGGGGLNCILDATDANLLIKFHHLIDHPSQIMFWSSTDSISRFKQIKKKLHNARHDTERLPYMTMRYLQEYHGDATPTVQIINYVRTQMRENEAVAVDAVVRSAEVSTSKLVKELELDASNTEFVAFRQLVDQKCLIALDNIYGQFSSFTTPILTQETLSFIADSFKCTLPKQYHAISSMLNRARFYNQKKFEHLLGQWDRENLYQFLSICRKRNPRFFTPWALINKASSYGGKNVDIQVFFGLAITVTTMLRKLNQRYPFEMIMRKANRTLLDSGDLGVCVFDNSQMIQSLKFQSGGHSSEVSLVTSRLFLKPRIPTLIGLQRWPHERVPLTYANQIIPSPPGMPPYESIEEITPDIFDGATVCTSYMDITGRRVEKWAELVILASTIYKFQRMLKSKDTERFEFQYDENIRCMRRLRINSRMQKNRELYQKAKHFQHLETLKWRDKPKKAEVIIPPISPHDETTKSGAAKVILSLLLMFGILQYKSEIHEEEDTDMANMELAPESQNRHLIMVGDGLSQIRARQFLDLIDETSTSFGPRHETTLMLQKALDQVIFVPGDLHGGGFHILQIVYNLFYGAIIQKVQTVLQWKRICGSDVSKCYQQAASLASLTAQEMERHLISEYFKGVCNLEDALSELRAVESDEEFAIYIAKLYKEWIKDKRGSTTDQVFRMTLNFVTVMNLYRLFKVSVRAGDAVTIEWIYKEVLPLFNVTGKKHYFEITLKQMEDLYNKISYKYLHLTRINRTVPLYDGLSKQGEPMANWALDGLIETVQKFYHKMNFHTGKSNGWLKHSGHVMVMSKASRIVMEEYSRLNSKEDKDSKFVDHTDCSLKTSKGYKNTKASSTPKRTRECCAVAEYLLLAKITTEIPGQVYNDTELWDTVSNCTVQLTGETDRERADRIVRESQTEEENLLDQFTDDLYNGTNRDADDDVNAANIANNSNNDADGDEGVGEILDPAQLAGRQGEDADDDGDDNEDIDLTDDSNTNVVTVTGPGIGGGIRVCANVKKCEVNELILNQDIMAYSKMELEKMNLGVVRVHERARRLRMKAMSTAVMESVLRMRRLSQGTREDSLEDESHLQSSFSRLDREARTGRGGILDFTI